MKENSRWHELNECFRAIGIIPLNCPGRTIADARISSQIDLAQIRGEGAKRQSRKTPEEAGIIGYPQNHVSDKLRVWEKQNMPQVANVLYGFEHETREAKVRDFLELTPEERMKSMFEFMEFVLARERANPKNHAKKISRVVPGVQRRAR